MTGVLEQLLVALAGFVVIAYPGAFLLAALPSGRSLDPLLHMPAALSITLVSMGVVLLPSLWMGWSIGIITAIWFGVLIASVAASSTLDRARHNAARDGSHWSLTRWLVATSPVGWIATWPTGVRIIALLAAVITFIAGGWIDDGDMQYHTAIARKLAELDHPTFASIQAFVDGSLHPGYPAPPFHALVAMQAFVTSTDTATVMWMIAVPAAVASIATWAGLGRVLFGSARAATITAACWMLINGLARVPLLGALAGAAAPNAVALQTLIPFAISCWIISLDSTTRSERRSAVLLLTLVIVPALTFVHASYLTFLAILVSGYLLVWGAWSRPRRADVARHARVGILLAFSAIVCLVALWPALRELATFDAAHVAAARESEFAQYADILVGTPDRFHLHWSMLFWFGGLCWLGALGALHALRFHNTPAARYLVGALIAVGFVTQIDGVFTAFSHAVSVHQSKRIGVVLPVSAGLACAIIMVGDATARAWHAGRRIIAAMLVIAACSVMFSVTWRWKATTGFHVWSGSQWPWITLIGATLCVGVWGVAMRIRRVDRGNHSQPIDTNVSRASTVVATVVLAIGTIPVTQSAAHVLVRDVHNRPSSALRAYDLAYIDPAVLDALQRVPQASVIMAPVEHALRIQAIVPVYTVAIPVANCARTRANRPVERRDVVERFYARSAGDDVRYGILRSEHVHFIYTTARTASVRSWLAAHPDRFTRLRGGEMHELWRVAQ